MQTITLHEGITSISADAFRYSGLTEISFPSTLKSVGQYAFQYCDNLTSVELNQVESLGTGAFYGCESLNNVVLPVTLKTTAHHIFTDCSSLTNIQILSTDAIVYYSIVDRTPYFEDSSNWENSALYIGNYLIYVNDLTGSTVFNVKSGTTSIAAFAFNGNTRESNAKISTINLPNSLKIIGESAFEDMEKFNNN